jgi:hypothetical protein
MFPGRDKHCLCCRLILPRLSRAPDPIRFDPRDSECFYPRGSTVWRNRRAVRRRLLHQGRNG